MFIDHKRPKTNALWRALEARKVGINSDQVNFRDWKASMREALNTLNEYANASGASTTRERIRAFGEQVDLGLLAGRVSPMQVASIGSELILQLAEEATTSGFSATEQQWAGRAPIIAQMFLQHSMRVQQDVYVLVIAGGYLQSIGKGGPEGGLLWRLGQETTLDRSHLMLALHWPAGDGYQGLWPWTAINVIHIHTGKGKKLNDCHQYWMMIHLIAEMVAQRGDLYKGEDQLGILVPTNGLKKMLTDLLTAAKPYQDTNEQLPNPDWNLAQNLRQISGIGDGDRLSSQQVALALLHSGWISQGRSRFRQPWRRLASPFWTPCGSNRTRPSLRRNSTTPWWPRPGRGG